MAARGPLPFGVADPRLSKAFFADLEHKLR
jgi:hypothetical protein